MVNYSQTPYSWEEDQWCNPRREAQAGSSCANYCNILQCHSYISYTCYSSLSITKKCFYKKHLFNEVFNIGGEGYS